MAIRHIRDAYNQEAGQHSICQEARLDYVSAGAGGAPQKQVITLSLVHADGTSETVTTPIHEMSENPHEIVRALAKDLKARDGVKEDVAPAPYVPPPIDAPATAWEKLKDAPATPPAPAPVTASPSTTAPPARPAGIPKNPWIE